MAISARESRRYAGRVTTNPVKRAAPTTGRNTPVQFLAPLAGTAGRASVAVGVFGGIAKGIVPVMVGLLFCVASATVGPSKSSGLDGGLKTRAALPFGALVLVVVGAGLVAHSIFRFVTARYAPLQSRINE